MSKLPDYTALGARDPQPAIRVPDFPDRDPVATAVQGLGQVVGGVGDDMLQQQKAAKTEQDQRVRHDIRSRLLQGEMQWREHLEERKRTAEPGARGFTANTLKDYDSFGKKFYQGVPEQYRGWADEELLKERERLEKEAGRFEETERTRHTKETISQGQDTLLGRQMQSPGEWADIDRQGEEAIRDAPGLTAIEKDEAIRDWQVRRAKAYAEIDGEDDPEGALGRLRTLPSPSGKLPRGVRNNNPGNIEYGDFARKQGAIGSDGRFARFETPEQGIEAMHGLLQSYQRQGRTTVREMISRWAPESENKTSAYVDAVSKAMGVDPDTPFDFAGDRARADKMVEAMIRHENGYDPYAALSYEERQNLATRLESSVKAANTIRNEEVKTLVVDDLVSIRETGQPLPVDETEVRLRLGKSTADAWLRDRKDAVTVYEYTRDMAKLPPLEIESLVEKAKPVAGKDYPQQKRIHEAVTKVAEKIALERGKNPAAAALRIPEVAEAQKLAEDSKTRTPATVKAFVDALRGAQKDFGIPRRAIAPVPDTWAREIGRTFLEFPSEITRDNRDRVAQVFGDIYDGLHAQFGDETGDIIRYSLARTEALGKASKRDPGLLEAVLNMLRTRELGRPLTEADRARLRDIEAVPDTGQGGFWNGLWGIFSSGEEPPAETAAPQDERPTIDEMTQLTLAEDEDVKTEMRDDLVSRYGEEVVAASERDFREQTR